MLTLRYNEPVFILMLRGRVGCLSDFKHELLNRLRSTMAVNVLILFLPRIETDNTLEPLNILWVSAAKLWFCLHFLSPPLPLSLFSF